MCKEVLLLLWECMEMKWRMELADGVELCLDLEAVLALWVKLFLEHYLYFWQSSKVGLAASPLIFRAV